MEKIIKFFKEVKQEMVKVSWPKRDEIWSSTGIVIVVSFILSGIIWVLDMIFSNLFLVLFR